MAIYSNVITNSSGSVGIGTTDVKEKLQVYGDLKVGVLAAGSFISLADESSTARYVGIYRSAGDTLLGLGAWGGIKFHASNTSLGSQTEWMRLDTSGRLGIGVTNPTNILTINKGNGTGINVQYDNSTNVRSGLFLFTRGSSIGGFSGGSEWDDSTTTARSTAASSLLASAGTLLFYTNSGLTSGNTFTPSERMRIDTLGNFGVGTDSPSSFGKVAFLDSAGNNLALVNPTAGSVASPAYTTIRFFGYGNTERARITGIDNASNNLFGQLAFWTGASGTMSERMRIDSSGNVGIGTTTPDITGASKGLTINGASSSAMEWMVNNALTGYVFADTTRMQFWTPGTSNVEIQLGTGAAYPVRLYTNATERMRIDSSGNVGIGTTNPRTKTHMWSTSTGANIELARYTSTYAAPGDGPLVRFTNVHPSGLVPNAGEYNLAGIRAYDYNSNWGGALQFLTAVSTGNGGALTAAMTISTTQDVGIGTATTAARVHVIGSSTASTPTMIVREGVANPTGGALAFEVENSAGTSILLVSGSGNVGINVSPTSFPLGVFRGTTTIPQISAEGTSGVSGVSGYNFRIDTADLWQVITDNNAGNGFYIQYNNSTGARNFAITTAGNVGIGVTNPSAYKLQVNGGLAVWDGTNGRVTAIPSNSANTGYFEWRNGSATRLGYMGGGSSTNMNITMENSANLLIDGGNVGIGTATVAARLHVFGSSTATTPTMLVKEGVASPTNGALAFEVEKSTGATIFAVSGSGFVGVGTSNPAGTFEVVGVSGSLLLVTDNLSGSLFSVNDVTGLPILEVFSDDTLIAGRVNTNALVVTGSIVGVGTRTPSNTLDVNGTVRVRSVSNATGNFATYSGTGVLQQRTAAEVKTDLSLNNVQNLSVSQIFNNTGAGHGTRSDFANITDFGYQYVQGSTNGPNLNSATQYYAWTIGLGSEYSYASYAAQFAIPRFVNNPYMGVRFREAGTWNAWQKLAAGNADTLTTARTLWGQSFDGSGNVIGNLTSVGNITGTGAVTLTASGAGLSLVATGANVITATTNSTEALRITSGQNVGINTSTVSARLHVYGGGLRIGGDFATGGYPIQEFQTVRLDSNDRDYQLVSGGVNCQNLFMYGYLADRTTRASFNYAWYSGTGSDPTLQLTSGAAVGVGITNPSSKLHVAAGDIRFDSSYGIIGGTNTAGNVLRADGTRFVPAQLSYSDLSTTNMPTRTVSYSSITGASGDWFPIFKFGAGMTTGAAVCTLSTASHSSVTFAVNRGWPGSNFYSISVLNCVLNPNGGYPNVTELRVIADSAGTYDAQVEAKLTWSSGPTVIVTATVMSSPMDIIFAASLATTAAGSASPGVSDSVVLSNNMMRSKGNFVTPANVGIGTTNPGYKLHIVDSGNTQAWVSSVSNSAGISIENQGQRNWQIWADRTNDKLQIGNNSRAGVNVSISADSNVGIGTTAQDGYRLRIFSSGAAVGFDNQAVLAAKNSAGGFDNFLWPRWSDNIMYMNYGSGGFWIRNNSSASTMFMTNDNKVGIGTTTSITSKLAIYDSSVDQIYIRGTSTVRAGIRIDNTAGYQSQILLADNGTDKWQFGKQTDNTFFVHDATATKNIIQGTYRDLNRSDISLVPYQDGRVGIGTDPSTNGKLEIYATGSLQGIFQSDGTRWLRTMAGTAGSGAYNNIVQSNDYAMIFSGSKASLGSAGFVIAPWDNTGVITSGLRMDASGNVGINTASMSRKLVVHGSDALINDITIGRGGLSPSATSVTNTVLGNSTFGQATSSQTGNVAIGYLALNNATTGADGNVAMGALALNANTTAKGNVGIGYYAMSTITTASGSVAVGYEALKLATGADNTAVGWWAGKSISTATGNVAVGSNALATATTSGGSTAVGAFALYNNTSPYNTAVGFGAGVTVSTGLYNTSLGAFAGGSISSQSNSTAVGYSALVNATGAGNSAFGYNAGSAITSSTKNLILGGYTGNAGGLDIRTSTASINSNNIILSDGDGTIQARFDYRGAVGIGTTTAFDGYKMHICSGSVDNTLVIAHTPSSEKSAGFHAFAFSRLGVFEMGTSTLKIGSTTSNALSLVTNNTRAIYVDTSQRVGIGTDTMVQKLHIGAAAQTMTATPDSISLGGTYSDQAGVTSKLKLRLYDDGAGVVNGFGVSNLQMDYSAMVNVSHVWYINNTEVTRINASGNVGIGTATVGARLHVYSGATDEVARFEATSNPYISLYDTNVRQAYFYSNTSSVELVAESSKPLYLQGATEIRLRTGGLNDRVTINSSGKVGVGTTNPSEFIEAFGTDAGIICHYNANTRGGIWAFSNQRLAVATTASSDDVCFGYTGSPGSSAGFVEIMRVDNSASRVGILTTAPAYTLEVIGTAGKTGGGSWSTSSDQRLKENIVPLTGSLDKLLKIRGVEFDWRVDGRHDVGVIAQEVEKIFPEWVIEVSPNEQQAAFIADKVKSFGVGNDFFAYAVEAFRELKSENDSLKSEIQSLKDQISSILEMLNNK